MWVWEVYYCVPRSPNLGVDLPLPRSSAIAPCSSVGGKNSCSSQDLGEESF